MSRSQVVNCTVAANTLIDAAKDALASASSRLDKLEALAEVPGNAVNPVSVAKLEDAKSMIADAVTMAADADASLGEFAQMNAISLS